MGQGGCLETRTPNRGTVHRLPWTSGAGFHLNSWPSPPTSTPHPPTRREEESVGGSAPTSPNPSQHDSGLQHGADASLRMNANASSHSLSGAGQLPGWQHGALLK